MDVMKMLKELRSERENLDEAIVTLERLAIDTGKRRGRPPKWMTAERELRSELQLSRRKGPGRVGRAASTQAKTA